MFIWMLNYFGQYIYISPQTASVLYVPILFWTSRSDQWSCPMALLGPAVASKVWLGSPLRTSWNFVKHRSCCVFPWTITDFPNYRSYSAQFWWDESSQHIKFWLHWIYFTFWPLPMTWRSLGKKKIHSWGELCGDAHPETSASAGGLQLGGAEMM